MKYNHLITTSILAIGIMMFHACKKDRTTVFVNNTTSAIPSSQFSSLASFYKILRPASQSFQVDATTGGTIRGDRGMTFQFSPNSFRNSSGMTVTGKVKISLTEVTNYAEMMGTSARTEAINGILGSAAMFNITGSQNGNTLITVNAITASIPVNTNTNLDDIKLFSGILQKDTSTQDTAIKWATDSIPFVYNADSVKQIWDSIQKEYQAKLIIKFNLYVFGWCNLDAYYNSSSGFPVKVTYTGVNNLLSAEVYMKLNENYLKGIYKLTYNPLEDEFNSTYYNLPQGWNIHIIVLLKDKDKKVYKEDRIISNSNTIHNFSNLKEISDSELESFFTNLK